MLEGEGGDEDEGGLAVEVKADGCQAVGNHGHNKNNGLYNGDPVGEVGAEVLVLINEGEFRGVARELAEALAVLLTLRVI